MNLTEVLVATAVSAIVTAAVLPNVGHIIDRAKVHRARAEVMTIQNAVNMYNLDTNGATLNNLNQLTQLPDNIKPYMRNLPTDPWGRPYRLNNGIVSSFGPDKAAGGTGLNADIIATNAF